MAVINKTYVFQTSGVDLRTIDHRKMEREGKLLPAMSPHIMGISGKSLTAETAEILEHAHKKKTLK